MILLIFRMNIVVSFVMIKQKLHPTNQSRNSSNLIPNKCVNLYKSQTHWQTKSAIYVNNLCNWHQTGQQNWHNCFHNFIIIIILLILSRSTTCVRYHVKLLWNAGVMICKFGEAISTYSELSYFLWEQRKKWKKYSINLFAN